MILPHANFVGSSTCIGSDNDKIEMIRFQR